MRKLTVGSGEKRLSFRSSENASRTIVHYSMYVPFDRKLSIAHQVLSARNRPDHHLVAHAATTRTSRL